jgi:hypothetical protein
LVVVKAHGGATDRQLAHAGQLADALDLDVTRCWKPTAASYFGRVSKAETIGSLQEADRLGGQVCCAKIPYSFEV